MNHDETKAAMATLEAIERYSEQGLLISVTFGDCGGRSLWSVAAMNAVTGTMFNVPFVASSFGDIAEILEIEAPKLFVSEKN